MKDKLEVGMYVRTKVGIAKIIGQNDDVRYCYPNAYISDTYLGINDDTEYLYEEDILKASNNIIDLIEENDYIRIITSAYFEPVYYSYGKLVIRDDIPIENYSNDFIAEVITYEQMKSVSYKVD